MKINKFFKLFLIFFCVFGIVGSVGFGVNFGKPENQNKEIEKITDKKNKNNNKDKYLVGIENVKKDYDDYTQKKVNNIWNSDLTEKEKEENIEVLKKKFDEIKNLYEEIKNKKTLSEVKLINPIPSIDNDIKKWHPDLFDENNVNKGNEEIIENIKKLYIIKYIFSNDETKFKELAKNKNFLHLSVEQQNELIVFNNKGESYLYGTKGKDIDVNTILDLPEYQLSKLENLETEESKERYLNFNKNNKKWSIISDNLLNPQSNGIYVAIDTIRDLFGFKSRGLKDANGAYRSNFEAFLGEPIENYYCYSTAGVGLKVNSQASSGIFRTDDEKNNIEVSPDEVGLPSYRIQAFKTIVPIDSKEENYNIKIIYDTYLKAILGNDVKTKYEYGIYIDGEFRVGNNKTIILEKGNIRKLTSQITFKVSKDDKDSKFEFILSGLSKNNCDNDDCFEGESLRQLKRITINEVKGDDKELNYIFGRTLSEGEEDDISKSNNGNEKFQIVDK